MAGALDALEGMRVLDLSGGISGAYCAKLLADAGAQVVKVEPPGGHPLRRWSVSGAVGRDGDPDGALFRYLAAGQRSAVADLDEPEGQQRVLQLAMESDVVIESFMPGHLAARGLGPDELRRANPNLTVVSITSFGQEGPRSQDASNDFLLQALMGSLHLHGNAGGPPVAVGGRLGEWTVGAYAAAGVLAARARAERTGVGEHVDVAAIECLVVTFLAYPTLFFALPGGFFREEVYTMVPGVERCKDGWVGLATITVQQWHDFLAMIDRHDLIAREEWNDQKVRQREIHLVAEEIGPWFMERTIDEIVERASLFRVPAAPVSNGATLPELGHLADRELFQPNPRGGFPHPRPPFRTSRTSVRPVEAAPRLGEHDARAFDGDRATAAPAPAGRALPGLPLEGVRVIDLTAFWAGPFATHFLASMGADVIKVESAKRPDPMRFSTTVPVTTEQWYEYGFNYLGVNLNKRGITLDLSQPRGRDLLVELIATADVVIENFTPRVMENFGLTYDDLREIRPDIIMMRMPGWGLEGRWRDRPGFASTMEQVSGMAWVTGYPDGRPVMPGLCDPLNGIHCGFAVLAALEQRRATGEGQHLELAMIDMATNVAAEQLIEWSVYGHLMEREGNRGPAAAPQGAYRGADERWLAISVGSDDEWDALRRTIGDPSLDDPALGSLAGRRADHDRIDEVLAAWCGGQTVDDAVAVLRTAGVPSEPVVWAYDIDQDPQMLARGYWEEVDRALVGPLRYPSWPMKLSGGPSQWYRSAAPTLGEHNEEILGKELGLSDDEIESLRQADVIGDRLLR